jgi:hypothetical protein
LVLSLLLDVKQAKNHLPLSETDGNYKRTGGKKNAAAFCAVASSFRPSASNGTRAAVRSMSHSNPPLWHQSLETSILHLHNLPLGYFLVL